MHRVNVCDEPMRMMVALAPETRHPQCRPCTRGELSDADAWISLVMLPWDKQSPTLQQRDPNAPVYERLNQYNRILRTVGRARDESSRGLRVLRQRNDLESTTPAPHRPRLSVEYQAKNRQIPVTVDPTLHPAGRWVRECGGWTQI